MRRASPLLATALISMSSVGLGAQEPTVIQWKFQVGQKLHYQVVNDATQMMELMGQDMETRTKQTYDMTWEVKAIDAAGTADLRQKMTRVRTSMKSPMMSFDWDSASGKEPEGVMPEMLEGLRALVGAELRLKMTPTGKVTDFQVPAQLQDVLDEAGGQAGISLSPESFKNLMGANLVLPEEGLVKGQKWQRKSKIPLGMATMVMRMRYKYAGPERQGDRELEKITFVMDLETRPTDESPLKMAVKSMDASGAFHFDARAGHLAATTLKNEMVMEVEAMGKAITVEVVQKTSMKLVPGPKPKDS